MNCCNEFGHCVQGSNCAARAYRAEPAQVAKAKPARRSCDALGVCQGNGCTDCDSTDEAKSLLDAAQSNYPEAYPLPIWYAGDEPDEVAHTQRSVGIRASMVLVALLSSAVSVATLNSLFGGQLGRWFS